MEASAIDKPPQSQYLFEVPSLIEEQLKHKGGLIKKLVQSTYLSFIFEDKLVVLESWKDLWWHFQLHIVLELSFASDSWLYSLHASPNFEIFLKQIDAFSVQVSESALRFRSIVPINDLEWNPTKSTIHAQVKSLQSEDAFKLRSAIESSLTKEQKYFLHLSMKQHRRLPNERLRSIFLSDMSFVFLEKGKLNIHNTQQIPTIKTTIQNESAYKGHPVLDVQTISSSTNIFEALEANESAQMTEQYELISLIGSIQEHMYFTFYNHRFLIIHYTTFGQLVCDLRENQGNNSDKRIEFQSKFTETSALFAVHGDISKKHDLLSIMNDPDWNYPQLPHLLGKQLSQLMPPQRFMEVFTQRINHGSVSASIDIDELPRKFQLGSVLMYSSGLVAKNACVYLEADLVIMVHKPEELVAQQFGQTDAGEQEARDRIFTFSQFEKFVQQGSSKPKNITEIRFNFQPYDKNELIEKATLMSQEAYQLDTYQLNCEHLAFMLASGFKFSSMQNNIFNQIAETISSIFK